VTPLLASSFPDYSGLEQIFTVVVVAIAAAFVVAFVRVYRRGDDEQRVRYRGWARRVGIALLAWIVLGGVVALIVTSSS
jgi:hypothetical protein